MSTPDHDDHSEWRDALRRDAARIQEPPFDATLHHATIRRIRALPDTSATRFGLRRMPALATGGVALLLVFVVVFARREPPRTHPDIAAILSSTENHIASLSIEPSTSALPAWTSPTASLLAPPRISQ